MQITESELQEKINTAREEEQKRIIEFIDNIDSDVAYNEKGVLFPYAEEFEAGWERVKRLLTSQGAV